MLQLNKMISYIKTRILKLFHWIMISYIKTKILKLFHWIVNFLFGNKKKQLTENKRYFYFMGSGIEDSKYNLDLNSLIANQPESTLGPGMFDTLLHLVERNHPNKINLIAHSNDCDNLLVVLEYIITQSTAYKMSKEKDAWQNASSKDQERMTNAQKILNNIESIELSKPHPYIGKNLIPFRKIMPTGQNDDPYPIHFKFNEVIKQIKKNNKELKATVSHATKDQLSGGYKFYKEYEKEYCKKHKINPPELSFQVIEVQENSHEPFWCNNSSLTSNSQSNRKYLINNNQLINLNTTQQKNSIY